MNLQNEMQTFHQLTQEEQRKCCITVLEWVKDRGWIFSELYILVQSGNPSEKILSDIYESAMTVLHDSEDDNIRNATKKLEENKEELKKILLQEQIEREQEIKDIKNTLIF